METRECAHGRETGVGSSQACSITHDHQPWESEGPGGTWSQAAQGPTLGLMLRRFRPEILRDLCRGSRSKARGAAPASGVRLPRPHSCETRGRFPLPGRKAGSQAGPDGDCKRPGPSSFPEAGIFLEPPWGPYMAMCLREGWG